MAERCPSEFVQPGGRFSYQCDNEVGHATAHGNRWDENEDGVPFYVTWKDSPS